MRRAAVVLLLCVAACADSATVAPAVDSGAVVVARASRGAPLLPDPAVRHPSGSVVVRVAADGTETILSAGFDAAGVPAVHPHGDRVLFVGRRAPDEPFGVFECDADGGTPRRVVDHDTDCVRADYLPDGRIVYAASLDQPSPLDGVARGAALFVADGAGGAGARITFGAGLDTDPSVLSDGRVVFASWRVGAGRLGLFTVHPDGTGYAPFHLSDGHAVLPRQVESGDVHFVALTDAELGFRTADWDAPLSVSAPAEARGGEPLAPRRRPQGHLSSMREDRPFGTLVCVDARANGAPSATRVRVVAHEGGRAFGVLDLAADGSFMARVPPDTPLALEMLDADGAVVAADHGPFWVRNNEVRVCATCHDDVETGPPNTRPLAVLGDPVDLTGGGQ